MEDLKSKRNAFIAQGALGAGVIFATLSVITVLFAPAEDLREHEADMHIQPSAGQVRLEDDFTIEVVVDAHVPVNVFKGEVRFDPTYLVVDSINYNTSIADLWAELPWYENGEGTVSFAGGTTMKGGFMGSGSLITVTFRTLGSGDTTVHLEQARVLKHNGLGTDAILDETHDALFAIGDETSSTSKTVAEVPVTTTELSIAKNPPSTDLNGDGKQTLSDVSIFILNMLGKDLRFDFNVDGIIDGKDMRIIMDAR